MAKIKNITVKVTYTVGLGGLTAPKKVIEQLNEIADKGDEIEHGGLKYDEAQQWIIDNIKERDCYESTFEIVDLE
jgi:hypothetical protein